MKITSGAGTYRMPESTYPQLKIAIQPSARTCPHHRLPTTCRGTARRVNQAGVRNLQFKERWGNDINSKP